MFEYFAVLRVAASSAADSASRAAAATYESANGQMTVTSQVSGFPASQGTRERPSGHIIIIIIIIIRVAPDTISGPAEIRPYFHIWPGWISSPDMKPD